MKNIYESIFKAHECCVLFPFKGKPTEKRPRICTQNCPFPCDYRLQEVEGLGLPELDVGNLGKLAPDNGEEALQVAEPVRGRQQVRCYIIYGQHL
jgi:hypothetical protein